MKVAQHSKPGRPKSEAKKNAILYAAAELFLTKGFTQTSMDGVAKLSGVSKQTIYSHYKNKDALFSAVIEAKCDQYQLDPAQNGNETHCLRSLLMAMAAQYLELFHDPEVIAMYSTVIAEGKNTPHVAELFYKSGPQFGMRSFAQQLMAMDKSTLDTASAQQLALDFYNLLKADFHMRSLMGLPYSLTTKEKDALVEAVVNKTLCLHHHYYQ